MGQTLAAVNLRKYKICARKLKANKREKKNQMERNGQNLRIGEDIKVQYDKDIPNRNTARLFEYMEFILRHYLEKESTRISSVNCLMTSSASPVVVCMFSTNKRRQMSTSYDYSSTFHIELSISPDEVSVQSFVVTLGYQPTNLVRLISITGIKSEADLRNARTDLLTCSTRVSQSKGTTSFNTECFQKTCAKEIIGRDVHLNWNDNDFWFCEYINALTNTYGEHDSQTLEHSTKIRSARRIRKTNCVYESKEMQSTCSRALGAKFSNNAAESNKYIQGEKQERDIQRKNFRRNFDQARPSILLLLLFLLSLKSVVCENMKVTWNMRTKPIIFGKSANLTCSVTGGVRSCATNYQRWYGGKNNRLLCSGRVCRDKPKYYSYRESDCSFTLQISNFSEHDVNCEYSCIYLADYKKKILSLDKDHFQYIPLKQEISVIYNTTNSSHADRNIKVEVNKIFPIPVCNVTFDEENIIRFVDVIPRRDGIFYNVLFNISHYPGKCTGMLKINCEIGSTVTRLLNKNITFCKDRSVSSNNETLHTVMAVVIAIIVVVILVIVCKIGKRLKVVRRLESPKEQKHRTPSEMKLINHTIKT